VSGPDPDSTGEAGDLMGGFRARRRGGVTARFAASQANIIRALVSQVEELIAGPAGEDGAAPGAPGAAGGGGAVPGPLADLEALLGNTGGPAAPPDDPVLARLLPDAYRDDTEAAGEFRRFTEQELRSGKLAAAQTVLDTLPEDGGRVELTEEDAQVWLRALNDVRLALGVRLEITEDTAQRTQDLDPADPRSAYLWVYDWLTYLQETLVRALW
jgi:Domain of unknown function (DUF2017)